MEREREREEFYRFCREERENLYISLNILRSRLHKQQEHARRHYYSLFIFLNN